MFRRALQYGYMLGAHVAFLSACDLGSRLYLSPVWPEEAPAVLIITDDSGTIIEPTPMLIAPPIDRVLAESSGRAIVFVQTFSALADRNLDDCFVTLNEGEPLGAASVSWSSGLVSLEGSIELKPEEEPAFFPLRLTGCSHVSSCDVLAQQLVTPETAYGLEAIVSVDDTTAFAAGGPKSETDLRTVVMRISGTEATETDIGLIGYANALEDDGTGLIGTGGFRIFRLAYDGSLTATAAIGFVVRAADTGEDGTTIAMSRDGDIAAIAPGSLEPILIEPPRYGTFQTPEDPQVAVVDRDSFVISGPDAVLYEWDGAWHELLDGEGFDALTADRDSILALPSMGAPLLYSRETGDWTPIGDPFAGVNAKRAVSFRDGRYLIVGQTGLVQYYNGDRMCVLPTVDAKALSDVDLAPSRRVAYASGDTGLDVGFDNPVLLRLELP